MGQVMNNDSMYRAAVAVVAAALMWAGVAQADADGRLTVVRTAADTTTVYDLDALRALGPVEVETSTPWTDGAEVFAGVPLARLIGTPRPRGGTVRLIALNDYMVEVPVADVGDTLPIVAYSRDGAPMSIRDKGPFWVIYPFDAAEMYRSEMIFSRSVWQLVRIEVHP